MQAIITKYLSPTNSSGPRIKARIKNNFSDTYQSLTIAYDHERSERDNHAAAAMKLVRVVMALDSGNNWTCGELPNGGYAFVMLGEEFSRYFGSADAPLRGNPPIND
jgi:hypothetical protein